MKIYKIGVHNFRLLKNFSIELEEKLSLVIGRNNVGKTSLLQVLDKFLNTGDANKKFQFNDFNIDYQNELAKMLDDEPSSENEYQEKYIRLELYIKYDIHDDLENISLIMQNLDPDNMQVLLYLDYVLDYTSYKKMKDRYKLFKDHENEKHDKDGKYKQKSAFYFLERDFGKFFKIRRRSLFIDTEQNIHEDLYVDLKDIPSFHIDDLINFQYISAKRNVDNRETDKTLSIQTSELYKKKEADETQQEVIEDFQDSLSDADTQLTEIYRVMFQDIIEKVERFGGMIPKETKIEIVSTLQHRELLKGNTTVFYNYTNRQLPENYNGLGYMNLISMIFEIETIRQNMKRESKRKPADINLIFIEEPEAHTHPQMQYIFIKNIKGLLKDKIYNNNGCSVDLQCIITTHSSHIVANCDFDDVKYMKLAEHTTVTAKSLKLFRNNKGDETFTFLKHYLTLNRCELFFAEKAVFIEGDTERILLPIMMKKLDQEERLEENEQPLLSQNISVIEVGAYSHKFLDFFQFIGLKKALVLTDLDICKKKGLAACSSIEKDDDHVTSNASLKEYFKKNEISELISLIEAEKTFLLDHTGLKCNANGNIQVRFQQQENNYQARSFEDNFFKINWSFISDKENIFKGLKQKQLKSAIQENGSDGAIYMLADKGIESKATLASDILINSKSNEHSDFSNWHIPSYIREGLLWLRKK